MLQLSRRVFHCGLLLAPALLVALAAPAHAGVITLSGAVAFNANADGSANLAGVTATSGCCQFIWVELDHFTGNQANGLTLPTTLTDGSHTIYLETSDWTSGFGVSEGGVNLFFDSSLVPGISFHLAPGDDKTVSTPWTVTGSSVETLDLSNTSVLASGTSAYSNGSGGSVTLAPGTVNWIGGTATTPYDASLTVQRIDVTVAGSASSVPEPKTALLLAPALLWLLYRRRRATAN